MGQSMGGYTVFSLADEYGSRGSGLTLAEAFVRVMALTDHNYVFRRIDGDMRLSLMPSNDLTFLMHCDDTTEDCLTNLNVRGVHPPEHRSQLTDDAMARAAIMREFLRHEFKGYQTVPDEFWCREEAKCVAREMRAANGR